MEIQTEVFASGTLPDAEVFARFSERPTLLLVFAATEERSYLQRLLNRLRHHLPHASIVGASSDEALTPAGIVGNGNVVVSALGFEEGTSIRTASVPAGRSGEYLIERLGDPKPKLLIAFCDAAAFNGEIFLEQIHRRCPDAVVSGGVAATPTFTGTFVIESDMVISGGAAVASIASESLSVYTDYSFGWQAVGRSFRITRAEGNRIVSIAGITPARLFAKYLGEEVVAAMPGLGSAFPLIVKRDEMLIARGILSVEGESFFVSGNVREGDQVYIGYGNLHTIIHQNEMQKRICDSLPGVEAILNFYCMGRKLFLPRNIVEYEERLLNGIAPTAGMFTLGEFFGTDRADLFNFVSTVVALTERSDASSCRAEPVALPKIDEVGLISQGLFRFIDVRVRELEHIAYYDELTGLPNRTRFLMLLERAIGAVSSSGGTGALFFIDLDNFKNINDTAGHSEGDVVLQRVARRLERRLGEKHTLCRFGGDEFVVIVEEMEDGRTMEQLAESILETLKERVEVGVRTYYLTASIGISFFSEKNTDIDELLKQADIAMYRSKTLGKNRWSFYLESMGQHAREYYRLEQELRRAIERRELLLHYQPQYDILSGEIVALEALVRWEHPERGLLYPDSFIEIAESSGLIVPFGEVVMDMALSFVAECPLVERVAVNISSRQFNDPGFLSMVLRLLKKYDLRPANLELEMTESVVMDDDSETTEMLFALAKEGITLSIDDFGTGYSSLSYLKRMPISTLKIDRSFVMDIPADESDVAIVRSIVAMAKALGLGIVAEGIETVEQADFFRKEGAIVAQGYFFARPLNTEAVRRLLRGD
ncbi:bifunctional diguanylate cyclase/phosphodiesterase [Hydrogenimonas sp.]